MTGIQRESTSGLVLYIFAHNKDISILGAKSIVTVTAKFEKSVPVTAHASPETAATRIHDIRMFISYIIIFVIFIEIESVVIANIVHNTKVYHVMMRATHTITADKNEIYTHLLLTGAAW